MKKKPPNPFAGRWRITWMEQLDQEYIDEEVEGYFEFKAKGNGSFHFGYVHGEIDYRLGIRDGQPSVEFTWDGNDEMDPAQGRGWATIEGNEITGQIFFHQGDESGFNAKRQRKRR